MASAQEELLLSAEAQAALLKPKEKPLDIRMVIGRLINRNYDSKLLLSTPKNYAHIMSVAISFDLNGQADRVYFSRKISEELAAILKSRELLSKEITDKLPPFKEYKDRVVLFPIIFYDPYDKELDYKSGFLNHLNGMWPDLNEHDQKKTVVMLDTHLNVFFRRNNY